VKDVVAEIIDPQDYFNPVNVGIHGISEDDAVGRPTFREFFPTLERVVEAYPIASHTFFDRTSLSRACEKCGCQPTSNPWVDSATVARRCWPDLFGASGYGLKNVAETFGIKFRHHDAGEDARVTAEILLRAADTGTFDFEAWAKNGPPRRATSRYARYEPAIRLDGNPDGPLYGQQVVFTGTLSIGRAEAANLAANLGLSVNTGVTKKASLVVVGDQDIRKPEWGEKSWKHRKAEELIAKGCDILILSESDFFALIDIHSK
jgi:DNA polymerase-3 subunit epsilon